MQSENSRIVLIVDQLEELITKSTQDDMAGRFIELLTRATASSREGVGHFTFVGTLRADFYAAFLGQAPTAPQLLQEAYLVGSLTSSEIRQAIEGPATLVGITFEEGLVDRILRDAETPDALPLLSFVLRKMYDAMDHESRVLTHALYEELGTLQGALGLYANQVFTTLPDSTGEALIEAVLHHLVTITPGGTAARRRAALRAIPSDAIPAVDGFIEARLLIAGEEDRTPTVEVAHEALFRNWHKLATRIAAESAAAQYLHQVLTQGVADWERLGVYLGVEQRRLLNESAATLTIAHRELEFVLRSSIHSDDRVQYWFERAQREGLNVDSILESIFRRGDPASRQHLLDFIQDLIEDQDLRYVDYLKIAAESEYPALRRQAKDCLVSLAQDSGRHTAPAAANAIDSLSLIAVYAGQYQIGEPGGEIWISVDSFAIGRFLVTNKEYQLFVKETGHRAPLHWESGAIPRGKREHPVVYVSFYDAVAYCQWLSAATGQVYRVPSEVEWEIGASWCVSDRAKLTYPWGASFDSQLCNTWESGLGETTPIGQFSPAGGDSPLGLCDAAGNVWEWTSTVGRSADGAILPYPSPERNQSDLTIWAPRVQRGGTFLAGSEYATTSFRLFNLPDLALQDFGFRVVREGRS
jgi:hypothetical protein